MKSKSLLRQQAIVVMAVILLVVSFLSGCKTSNPSDEVADALITNGQNASEIAQTQPVTVLTPEGFDTLLPGFSYSPYTGRPMPSERLNYRPLTVMFDNLFKARPQKGLKDADIVYEALVEGLITRYMAVFHSITPEEIGPVRSARPYFVRLALENDGYYSHIGGSNEAFSDIVTLKVADLDGMNVPSRTYWRKDHKPKPNNMYTSGEALLKVVKDRGYRSQANTAFWTLGVPDALANAESDPSFKIIYKASTAKDSVGYFVEFVYNEKATLYERLVNGKPHIDEGTGNQLTAKSVVIQRVKTRVLDNAGRLKLDVVGKGTGYYMCAGKRLEITWEKTTEAERTRFYDAQGQPLAIMPGQLWVQLVPSDFQLMD